MGKGVKFGKTSTGKVRYRCTACHRTFGRKKRIPLAFSDFYQFKELVTGKVNREKIIEEEQICRETLSVKFKNFFDHPITPKTVWKLFPPEIASGKNISWVYGVDGKYLHRNGVFIIHRSITTKENLYWSFWPSESYLAFDSDLKVISGLLTESDGNFPDGAVSDWKGAIVMAVAMRLGNIPHQRCLTHVGNMAKRLLPKNSPFEATRTLRKRAGELDNIGSEEEKIDWLWSLNCWEQKYSLMLKEKTIGVNTRKKWWYTHGNLRRGFRLLTHDQNPFFVYLDYPMIPKSNNSLEGTNSQLAKRLRNHRGMKTQQQVSFLYWYFAFQRIKTRRELKRLWDVWKKDFCRRLSTQNLT